MLEDLGRRPLLDDPAGAHDDHLVAQGPDHAQVVADEEVGEVVARLQLAQQVHDLRLDRHVEGRGRLVEDDEARPQHHRARDGDALSLAAGELVGIAVAALGVESDLAQRLVDHAAALGGSVPEPVDAEPFLDDLRRRQPRREGPEGVLEHHLHLPSQ